MPRRLVGFCAAAAAVTLSVLLAVPALAAPARRDDTTPPTATILVADTSITVGETSLVTITFSEAVTGFAKDDLTAPSGTVTAVSTTDNITYTVTFTPAASTTDSTNVITLDNAGVVDRSLNVGTGTAESNNYAVDTVRPTASIVVVADNDLRAGETSLVTITFSEAVTGFDNSDLTDPNATLAPVSSPDGGITWTATLTPTASITDATNLITLDNAGVSNGAGNPGTGTSDSNNYAVNTTLPPPPPPTDVIAPISQAAGPSDSTTPTWSITYTASDDRSGIASVDLYVLVPGATTYTTVGTDTTQDGQFTYTGTTDGNYLFHTIATDNAGNIEPTPASPDLTTELDTHAPSSQGAGPSQSAATTWTITYTSSDETSGIASVDLYVLAPGATTYAKVGTDSTIQDGLFTYTGTTDGRYLFHTVATDNAGNVESTPTSPDVTVNLDTHKPVLRAATGRTPVSFDHSRLRRLALRFRVNETVSATFTITSHGVPVRSFSARKSSSGIVERRWRGRNDRGERVQPGRYRVVVVAVDAAGNRTTAHVAVRMTR
jgi:hypothetical protein